MPRAKRVRNRNGFDGDQQALLAAIVESSRDAIVSKDLDGIITSWNRGAQLVFGYSEQDVLGRSVKLLIPEHLHFEENTIIAKIKAGERIEHYETVRQRKDGELIHVSLTISPIRDEEGRIVGASKIARDITEKHRAEETQRMLMREVNHRSKNLLAVVEAMVRKTASSTSSDELVSRISQRLQALSAIQNLLIYGDWRGVDLRALAKAQTQPYSDERIAFEGPALMLQPPAAQALGLAFHELVTNALRHGSLSAGEGRVELTWSISEKAEEEPCLQMLWNEADGPPVSTPSDTSFGTSILQRATADALDGKVEAEYGEGGLKWHLCAPMRNVVVNG